MSDVSEDEKSPRLRTSSSKKREAGDGSVKSIEVPLVFRLMSSDSIGAQIIGCNLNGDNYLTWSRAMLIALRARNKLPFIDGSLEKPGENDPLGERWERCNSPILAWMFNTMDDSLQAIVAYTVDAQSLWNDLKERHSEGNQSRFLMGLTSEFNTIRSTILSIEPMPNLSKVYKMVANEERQKSVTHARESVPEAAVFLTKEETEQRRNCRKMGHTKSSCWALIGHPSWHSKSKTNPRKGPGQGQTRANSEPRAKAQFQRGPDWANVVQTGLSSRSPAERLETLPDEQFQRLLSMLSQDTMDLNRLVGNESNFVNLQNEWILKTGASRHMTRCLENFSRMIQIKGEVPVYIPNGGIVQAT
ncbi:hypothetical protein CRG98_002456 [Punica granatum]|uniref:Retrotransposon Copia-like N-terminal domain-containing protein n=1 Tax=Punica granatum TaxID=22663 RepID=A0A2I0L8Z5_PUNGR|nr:hypothetical protein CRG98_002456 [Punica granatum]